MNDEVWYYYDYEIFSFSLWLFMPSLLPSVSNSIWDGFLPSLRSPKLTFEPFLETLFEDDIICLRLTFVWVGIVRCGFAWSESESAAFLVVCGKWLRTLFANNSYFILNLPVFLMPSFSVRGTSLFPGGRFVFLLLWSVCTRLEELSMVDGFSLWKVSNTTYICIGVSSR